MSKVKITKALANKGLVLDQEASYFARSIPVPESFTYGWFIELTEDSTDLLYDKGYDYNPLNHDFYNITEVLEWVDSLPNCKEEDNG